MLPANLKAAWHAAHRIASATATFARSRSTSAIAARRSSGPKVAQPLSLPPTPVGSRLSCANSRIEARSALRPMCSRLRSRLFAHAPCAIGLTMPAWAPSSVGPKAQSPAQPRLRTWVGGHHVGTAFDGQRLGGLLGPCPFARLLQPRRLANGRAFTPGAASGSHNRCPSLLGKPLGPWT